MLTHYQLKAIQEGNRRNADVLELLREIKRLRQLAVDTYTFTGRVVLANRSTELDEMGKRLRDALRAEPCVVEHQVMKEKLEQLEYRRRLAIAERERAGRTGSR